MFGSQLTAEMNAYRHKIALEEQAFEDFGTAQWQGKQRHALKSSVYATPFYLQI